MKKSLYLAVPLLLFLSLINFAQAHVKWFVEYNVYDPPPLPILTVISNPYTIILFILSLVILYLALWVDDKISPHKYCTSVIQHTDPHVVYIFRIGLSLSFLSLGYFFPDRILTPDLISDHTYIHYIHFLIALTLLFRKTTLIAILGLLFLYILSVVEYGVFHMIDYVIYLLIIVFLITDTFLSQHHRNLGIQILRIAIAFTFFWGALDKFTHPELYFTLIDEKPYIVFGMNWDFFVKCAGFIELCLSFLIVTGKTSAKIAAIVLMAFVLIAIFPFGLIDAVGHMVFAVVILTVTLAHNPYELSYSPLVKTLTFISVLISVFALHYGAFYLLNSNMCQGGAHHQLQHCIPKSKHLLPYEPHH